MGGDVKLKTGTPNQVQSSSSNPVISDKAKALFKAASTKFSPGTIYKAIINQHSSSPEYSKNVRYHDHPPIPNGGRHDAVAGEAIAFDLSHLRERHGINIEAKYSYTSHTIWHDDATNASISSKTLELDASMDLTRLEMKTFLKSDDGYVELFGKKSDKFSIDSSLVASAVLNEIKATDSDGSDIIKGVSAELNAGFRFEVNDFTFSDLKKFCKPLVEYTPPVNTAAEKFVSDVTNDFMEENGDKNIAIDLGVTASVSLLEIYNPSYEVHEYGYITNEPSSVMSGSLGWSASPAVGGMPKAAKDNKM